MVRVIDIFEQNQEEKDTIFIHLIDEKECDSLGTILWEGWLKDIPDKFMEWKVESTGQSLRDLENGIVGFYVDIINVEKVSEVFRKIRG